MKIDMGSQAITLRLKQASELRRLCLALADSSIGRNVRRNFSENPQVRRTSLALGASKPLARLSKAP